MLCSELGGGKGQGVTLQPPERQLCWEKMKHRGGEGHMSRTHQVLRIEVRNAPVPNRCFC